MTDTSAGIGHNRRFTLPDGQADAARYLFDQYRSMKNNRRWAQQTLTTLIKDAKANGHDPKRVRLQIRLGKMTPEQRAKWEETTREAAKMFGISMEYTGEEVDRDDPMWGLIEKAKALHNEKKVITDDLKDLWELARDNGFNPQHIKMLSDLKDKNDGEGDDAISEDWFHALDSLGSKLGFW